MTDPRPKAAAGHLFLHAKGVKAATQRLEQVGVRTIVGRENFAVLELRGGTHIVLRELEGEGPVDAPFDLMYDRIEDAQALFTEAGFELSDFKDGRIHRSFYATSPEGFRIQVLDSHAGDRPV
ncbi:MAG: VOC family protein [Myxococcota bacterium]